MSNNTISDERTEMMAVSPNTSMLQTAQFLLPSLSMEAPTPNRPSKPTSIISSHPTPLQQVNFFGWASPQPKWKDWVDSMKPVHGLVWKRVGIHDAIMNSLLCFPQNKRLVLWFAEKWSPKTNTFILPWGEITITLEDMMVLGGFSVLGRPATCHIQCPVEHLTLYKLKKSYRKIIKSSAKKATFTAWRTKFQGRQKAHEHEAFLAYWLSKYIFASVNNTILHETFELAILLARGQKIAMAPAVLATLYRDLHILQSAILDVHEGVTEMVSATVFSPMLYLQAWVWERFPCVRPFDLDNTRSGETRLARWARLDNRDINFGTLESVLGSEHFVWRPYVKDTNHFLALKVYNGNGLSRIIDNEAVESFARCLRVCKLVGLNINQHYYPHRVCRQFGYCQDIPAEIIQAEDDKDAWDDYSTPLSTGYVYVPSRDLQGHATIWYEVWWEKGPISHAGPRVPLPPNKPRNKMGKLVPIW